MWVRERWEGCRLIEGQMCLERRQPPRYHACDDHNASSESKREVHGMFILHKPPSPHTVQDPCHVMSCHVILQSPCGLVFEISLCRRSTAHFRRQRGLPHLASIPRSRGPVLLAPVPLSTFLLLLSLLSITIAGFDPCNPLHRRISADCGGRTAITEQAPDEAQFPRRHSQPPQFPFPARTEIWNLNDTDPCRPVPVVNF